MIFLPKNDSVAIFNDMIQEALGKDIITIFAEDSYHKAKIGK